MQQEFTLSFTENQWICFNNDTQIQADSLDEIDEKLEHYLILKYKKGIIKVAMFFDFDRFPQWHRQYMPHYFNRSLTFNLNK